MERREREEVEETGREREKGRGKDAGEQERREDEVQLKGRNEGHKSLHFEGEGGRRTIY